MILASFKANVWYAFLAGSTLILGAAYTLWLVKRVIFGPIANDHVRELVGSQRPGVPGALAACGRRARRRRLAGTLLDVMRATTQHLAEQLLMSKIVP